jgi:hypothetical protein
MGNSRRTLQGNYEDRGKIQIFDEFLKKIRFFKQNA